MGGTDNGQGQKVDNIEKLKRYFRGSASEENETESGKAKKEEKQLFKEAEKERLNSKANHFHRVFLAALWIVGLGLAMVFAVRVLHMVLPESWHWLNADQVRQADSWLFGGVVGSLFSSQLGKMLSSNTEESNQ